MFKIKNEKQCDRKIEESLIISSTRSTFKKNIGKNLLFRQHNLCNVQSGDFPCMCEVIANLAIVKFRKVMNTIFKCLKIF